ncbi:hypothetical protein PPYR_04860 [Photinus pyralis]|uniref:Uncharacterized protein n=3 Tax=Photinus pyralis TaxID=7054 RepID=A0A5N4AZB6_PHOPY|nr:hypothetical protein PPYR_04860 [Photinus pyralis]
MHLYESHTMSSLVFILGFLMFSHYSSGQIYTPTINLIDDTNYHIANLQSIVRSSEGLAHPVVVENAAREAQLPKELLNPFYKNPAIAAGLAKESLITNKEFAVFNRETEQIPRSEVLKIFNRAGFFRNRRR